MEPVYMYLAVLDPPAPPAPTAPPRRNAEAELQREVLERCKARDPMAFRAFVVRYERAVFALLSRLVGRGPHVEDLAQEVFLRAFRAFPTFEVDHGAKPSTWVLTIATRLALDTKKRRAFVTEPLDAADGASSGTTPETERARTEIGARITTAAAELPDDQRAVFVLAELHGMSMAEIAGILEIAENTVKTRLFRARSKLQQSLGSLLEDA